MRERQTRRSPLGVLSVAPLTLQVLGAATARCQPLRLFLQESWEKLRSLADTYPNSASRQVGAYLVEALSQYHPIHHLARSVA
jgi:hypothetical protein